VHDPCQLKSYQNYQVLYLNIQGLNNSKTLTLESFLHDLNNVLFLCISEHWLSKEEVEVSFPAGFYCASSYCRDTHKRGGTLVFARNFVQTKKLDVSVLCKEFHFELSGVINDELKVIIVSLYHSTSGNCGIFLASLEELFSFLSPWINYTILIGGDLNSNFDITREKTQ